MERRRGPKPRAAASVWCELEPDEGVQDHVRACPAGGHDPDDVLPYDENRRA